MRVRRMKKIEYLSAIAALFALILILTVSAHSDRAYAETARDGAPGKAVAETELPEIVLKPEVEQSSEELFRSYAANALSTDAFGASSGQAASKKKTLRRDKLNEQEKIVYDILKEKIVNLAAGEDDHAVVDIPLATLGIMQSYTAEELGLTSVFNPDDMSQVSEEARQAVNEKMQVRLMSILGAILNDFPYELYWYDKTSGIAFDPPKIVAFNNGIGGALVFDSSGKLSFKLYVAAAYSKSGGVQTFYTDTEKTKAATKAADKAAAIVEKYKNLSDLEKLKKYKEEVITLTDYNYDSVEEYQIYGIYGDPWQLIWVFDDNPETKVVCEGYSKAFQYLCDMTDFEDDTVMCHSATGDMYSDSGGGGPHMWNIVHMDGANYIVDLTNNDTVTENPEEAAKTHNDELFMAGAGGSFEEGYFVEWPNEEAGKDPYYIMYIYDEDTLRFFDEEELTISDISYAQYLDELSKPKITVGIALFGDSYHRTGEVHTLRAGNLEEWVPMTDYEIPEGSKVIYLLNKMLADKGFSGNVKDGNYISSIGNGNEHSISEKDNGTFSGWMFTVNGEHVNLGIGEKTLSDGDEVVLHYTDDYRLEADTLDVSKAEAVRDAIDRLPKEAALSDAARVYEARKALNKLDEEEALLSKLVTSAQRKKLADAEKRIQALEAEAEAKAKEDAAKALEERRIVGRQEIKNIIAAATGSKDLGELTKLSLEALAEVEKARSVKEIDDAIAALRTKVAALKSTANSGVEGNSATGNDSASEGDKNAPSDAALAAAKVDKNLNIKASSIATSALTGKKTMTVKWKKVSGATNYRIAYKKAGAKKWTYKWSEGRNSVVLTKMKNKGLYEFKLQAVKKSGDTWTKSGFSRSSYRYYAITKQTVKAGKKSVTVKAKKVKGATGYQVLYSTKKNMKGAKIKYGKKPTVKVSKLKKGTRYYVQARPVKKYKGKTYVGILSAVTCARAR